MRREALGPLKTARETIQDCSSPIQLRAYFNTFRNKVMPRNIRKEFLDRITFFQERLGGDKFYKEQLENLLDDLEFDVKDEPQYVNIDSTGTEIDTSPYEPYSNQKCPIEEELLRELFLVTKGLKAEVLKILKTEPTYLNRKIILYDLSSYISELRRRWRKEENIGTKFKDI